MDLFLIVSQVIGDKTAWLTSDVFWNVPRDKITSVVDDTEKKYGVQVKFIHIMRNPFDIISTITLRNTKLGSRFGGHKEKVRKRDSDFSTAIITLAEGSYFPKFLKYNCKQ